MFSKLRSYRPSPGAVSAILSCLALFFAVGGVGYAKKVVKLIDGSTIKKGTIQADRLSSKARTALKGNLGPQGPQGIQGPKGDTGSSATNANHANTADSATNATHALNSDQLGGSPPSAFAPSGNLRRTDWNVNCTDAPACSVGPNDVLSLGGLTLHAQCNFVFNISSNETSAELKLTGSGAANSETNVGYSRSDNTAAQRGYPGANGTIFDITTPPDGSYGEAGTIVYRDPGSHLTVTLSFFAYETASAGTCELYGNAQATTG